MKKKSLTDITNPSLKGVLLHPKPKISMFYVYLKIIINTFFEKYIYLTVNCPRNSKNGIEIFVGPSVFKLWIKTVKMLFGSITLKPLGLPKF